MRTFLMYLFLFFQITCFSQQSTKGLPELFPFVISYDGPDNVTNMSQMLEAPAGRDGFIRVQDGHFTNDAGAIRFNATNLTGPANFPSHAQSDLLAKRLARFGINCVRLHYMDDSYGNFKTKKEPGIFGPNPKTQRKLDSGQMDRLDYMISQFKKEGIYVNINLHVARKMDERDGFSGEGQRPHLDKGLDNFEPRMIALQKEYARDLLTHVNPYTGLAYTVDPCVAMIEINNENALFRQYFSGAIDKLPEPYSSVLQKEWNIWLLKKYSSSVDFYRVWKNGGSVPVGKLEDGSVPIVNNGESASMVAKTDICEFIFDVEQEYFLEMYNYVKNDLGAKAPISGTQIGHYSPPFIQSQLDYNDNHSYWSHPSPVNQDWKIKNISMVNSMDRILTLASERVYNKPYTISEYNHPFPNQFGAEGQPILRAYGRLQGWDAVFQYTYNHQLDFEPTAMTYFFDMISRTDVLAHMPACAAIFLRGDVQEAKSSTVVPIPFEPYFKSLVATKKINASIDFGGYDPKLSLIHKTSVDLDKKSEIGPSASSGLSDNQKVFLSDTGELTWNIEKQNAGYWTVNTPNTKLFTGFPEGRTILLGDIKLKISKTRLGWATVSMVSKNATGFGQYGHPANILLAATGIVENKGAVMENVSDTEIKLKDWGEGPIQAEGIPATIDLPSPPEKTKCFALDSQGERKNEIPVSKDAGGSRIVLKPEYKTVWYEIEIR